MPVATAVPRAVREFLATGPFAHVVTLDPDGNPHVSLAWAGVVNDEIVFATFSDQHKLRNLRRDPRVTLSFEAKENHGEVLHPYLVIRGRATVTDGGSLAVMDDLAGAYLGPGQRFPMRDVPEGFVVHLAPERFYGMGSWKAQLNNEDPASDE
jgi:PPOX class probable F420-dependent enzyme